ncbi:hypothetical protein Nepgr_005794 [Nepenthes gracilis]|uniref:MPN domain-containing protein n=1 Tax=Nepenthes gracilis TaxID=150966 RepID=A0AAD3S3U7_NEPGR|nr:hypothetical protein Nepgr_005794 [Nepenthes gracilis]
MRSSSGRTNIAASAQKLDVDNRISLRIYYRIAHNVLRQADIFRSEKNVIDLYIMLLRFSSLISETIPRHRDYRASPPIKKSSLRKQLLNALNELEELKPVVKQKIDELDRNHAHQVNGWTHMNSDDSVTSIDMPANKKQPFTNNQLVKVSAAVARDSIYEGSKTQQRLHTGPVEQQFQRLSLNISRPKEETLSRHSILGPNGLHGQWQPPVSNKGIWYPSNIDVTPVEIPSLLLAVDDLSKDGKDHGNVECKNSNLESTIFLNDASQSTQANDPSSLISFETSDSETSDEVIVKQPSPPPIPVEVQDLILETSSETTGLQDARDHPLPDDLVHAESSMELHISTTMMDTFMRLVKCNTVKSLETCGVLAGSLKNRKFYITTLIIPKQDSTSNSCQATNEEEIFEVQDKRSLFPLGWIHTHPTQSCFMSSIDLHTHYSYQIMLPEAVAIVMAPKDNFRTHGIFRLTTPGGMSVIRQCDLRGFHPHEPPTDGGPIYKQCTDVYMNPDLKFDVIDLR